MDNLYTQTKNKNQKKKNEKETMREFTTSQTVCWLVESNTMAKRYIVYS